MRLWSRYATRVTQVGGRLSRQEQAFSAGWGELYIAAGILGHCATLLYSKALFQDGLVWCWGAEEERAEEAEVCSVFTRVSSTSARCPIYYQPFSTIPINTHVHHTNLSFLLFLRNPWHFIWQTWWIHFGWKLFRLQTNFEGMVPPWLLLLRLLPLPAYSASAPPNMFPHPGTRAGYCQRWVHPQNVSQYSILTIERRQSLSLILICFWFVVEIQHLRRRYISSQVSLERL